MKDTHNGYSKANMRRASGNPNGIKFTNHLINLYKKKQRQFTLLKKISKLERQLETLKKELI